MESSDVALVAGIATTAVAGLVAIARELAKRHRVSSVRPPSSELPSTPKGTSISQRIRAVSEEVLERKTATQEEERMRTEQYVAVLETRDASLIGNQILEDILKELRSNNGKNTPSEPLERVPRRKVDGRYGGRKKFSSTGGG